MNVSRPQNQYINEFICHARDRRGSWQVLHAICVALWDTQIDRCLHKSARLRFVNYDGKIAIIPFVLFRVEIESSNRKGLGRGAASRVRLLDSLGAQFPEDGREKSHPLDKRLWRGGRASGEQAKVRRPGQRRLLRMFYF